MSRSNFVQRLAGVAAAGALSVGFGAATISPAQAAGSVWDRVAACESGGRWSINTGNGYYGGLQFSRSTWRAYGGSKYATTANHASKGQQIAIARRVLASQGPHAWPVCSRHAGLTRSNGHASGSASASGHTRSSKAVHHKAKATHRSAPKRVVTHASAYTAHQGTVVHIKHGDTLGKIAHRYHVAGGWRGVWKMNKARVHNPNRIYVGQVLRVK